MSLVWTGLAQGSGLQSLYGTSDRYAGRQDAVFSRKFLERGDLSLPLVTESR